MIIVIVSVGGWGHYAFPTVVKIMSYTRVALPDARPDNLYYVRCKLLAITNNPQQTTVITCILCAYAQDPTSGGMVVHRLSTGVDMVVDMWITLWIKCGYFLWITCGN